jgi:DNA-binding NarL/FixJ family response regulator
MEWQMRQVVEISGSHIVPRWVYEMKDRLIGKTVHVVGPRRLENELLVSFINKETGADCVVTDFDRIEEYLEEAAQEPSRLFLIDYREPRLREILKQASLNGNGSPLARRLVSLFNSGKENDTAGRKRAGGSCGILYRCESAADLLNWMCSIFNCADASENRMAESIETSRDTTGCPLTWRELQLLMMLTEGLRNQEIASRIGISAHTVRTHLYNGFGKIEARNRLEASAWIESHIALMFLLV